MGRPVAVRKKGNTPPELMQRGIDLHTKHNLSIRKAAKESGIPYQTLQRYVKKFKRGELIRLTPNYAVHKVFTEDQEISLRDYILDCNSKFYGLTKKDCCRIAYQMAKINNIIVPETWESNKMAGKEWFRGFKKRFPELSVKKPEAVSMARASAFNKLNVNKFFENLKQVYGRHPSFGDGSRVYNLDETATMTVHKPQKVVGKKGISAHKVTSGERGVLVTTCLIVNAHGQYLPPAMVFPRKKFVLTMLHGAPPGTLGLTNPTGWINSSLYVEVIRHFVKNTCASKENPALLIVDNHESHLSIEALDVAKENGVTVLTLPPHTTDKLQPLDVGINGPFKTFYNAAVDSLIMRTRKPVTIHNVAECVGVAVLKALTPLNITQAFKKCGIFPYDDNVFTEIDFLPSSVTDRPYDDGEDETVVNESGTVNKQPELEGSDTDAESVSLLQEEEPESSAIRESVVSLKQVSLKASLQSLSINPRKSIYAESNMPLKETQNIDIIPRPDITPPKASTSNAHISQASTSKAKTVTNVPKKFIAPTDFCSPIKTGPRKKTNTNRKRGKTMIATDTPEKDELAKIKALKKVKIFTKKATAKTNLKRVKHDLFKDPKKKKTCALPSSDTSDDDEESFKGSGSSSGGAEFLSASEDEDFILTEEFPPLRREPFVDDYVIIRFKSRDDNVYYIAKILEILEGENEECDFYVKYFKLKSKIRQKFVEPLVPDTAGVKRIDVKYILPSPRIEGTSRRTSTLKFPVDLSLLNLRY